MKMTLTKESPILMRKLGWTGPKCFLPSGKENYVNFFLLLAAYRLQLRQMFFFSISRRSTMKGYSKSVRSKFDEDEDAKEVKVNLHYKHVVLIAIPKKKAMQILCYKKKRNCGFNASE